MIIHNVQQGSKEWLELRKDFYAASDAAAMLGVSPYKTRTDLLKEKATGLVPEVNSATQRLFDDGHRFEDLARAIAEKEIGEDLFPCVGTEGKLLASFDGLTVTDEIAWEHKTLNDTLRAVMVPGCSGRDLPEYYQIQMEQQLMVSGAEKALFSATKWDEHGNLIEDRHCWYRSNHDTRHRILAGWTQFEQDLPNFEVKPEVAQAVGRTPENLPALRIELTGQVTASNLAEYKEHAFAVIQSINTDLKTDQDFADAEKTVKWCKEVEDRLDAAKQHALSQTATIDELFRTIDAISEETRAKRLELDRLVKVQKENRRNEIKTAAELAFRKHMDALLKRVSPVRFTVSPDFAGVMKGKRTIATLQDSVDTELARAKIEANMVADQVDANLKTIRAADHEFLFADLQTLAVKDPDDLKMVIEARITKHKADEQARLDAQREKIRAEEQAKLEKAEAEKANQVKVEPEKPGVVAQAAPSATLRTSKIVDVPFREPKAQSRPTDRQIIECLALQFRVHESKVIAWLLDMDLEAASQELEKAF